MAFQQVVWPLVVVALATPLVHEGDRVLLMGDSEAFLLQWEMPLGAKEAGVEFKTVAIPGSSVISWSMHHYKEWWRIRKWKPDVVLVSLGANDACIGARVVKNEPPYLAKFLERMKKVAPREVVWVGPPHIGVPQKGTKSLHPQAIQGLQLFAEMIEDAGLVYLDARRIPVQMWSDQLHCARPQFFGDSSHGCFDWSEWLWEELLDDLDLEQGNDP
jgi:hypothetical protein